MIREIAERTKKEVLRRKNEKGDKSLKITPMMIEEWERKTAPYYADDDMGPLADLQEDSGSMLRKVPQPQGLMASKEITMAEEQRDSGKMDEENID